MSDVMTEMRSPLSLPPALQFCGAQSAQRTEHAVANHRKELKRDKVVAGLLPVAQAGARRRKDDRQCEQHRQTECCFPSKYLQNGIAA